MWTAGGAPIAGLVPLSEAYWLGYVGVADVDRSVTRANDLGGNLLFGPHDIPKAGRFAVIEDPQGAAIAVFQGVERSPPPQPVAKPLEFSWHELATTDCPAAFEFYNAMFGWETLSENDKAQLGDCLVFGQKDVPYGAMFNKPPEMPRPAWCYYVWVADVHEATNKVLQNGGQIINGPVEAWRGDWIAHCSDPSSGRFAVRQTAPRAVTPIPTNGLSPNQSRLDSCLPLNGGDSSHDE